MDGLIDCPNVIELNQVSIRNYEQNYNFARYNVS